MRASCRSLASVARFGKHRFATSPMSIVLPTRGGRSSGRAAINPFDARFCCCGVLQTDEAAMKVVFEFYRTREADDAHAVVGREAADVADIADAIEQARRLWRTLDMPQQPDGLSISDSEGRRLYSGAFEARADNV